MSGRSLVSIVVRTRNRPLGLREALASLAAQTWPALEVVVVNDGGAPVRSVVEDALAPTPCAWTLLEWPDNRGRERAGNAGLAVARGEYRGFLDDDDVLYPEHVSMLMAHFAAHPDARVAYSDAYQATQEPDASAASGYRTLSRDLVLSWDVNPDEFRRQNWIPLHCVLFHRDCLAAVGGLDEELRRLEDWDFLLRLSWRFPMAHLKQVTAEYRHRTDHARLADPLGFGNTPAYHAALERIRGKRPERDAFAGAGGAPAPPDEPSGPARRWWRSLRL